MKKCLKRTLDAVQEFDLFAPGIALRYKSENDFKTYTGAVVSIALIVFFGVVFANKFIDMVNRTDITTTAKALEQDDPSIFDTSTPQFMFAIGLNSINMNTGLRYFNVLIDQYVSINQTKSKRTIEAGPCTAEMWKSLGDGYISIFNRLKMQDWLCPNPGQLVEFQGKFSSEYFRYIRITLTTCSGVVNGMACHTPAQVQEFITKNELFGFNYYFVNTLINPDFIEPISYFLDDSNHFTFELDAGIACNFYLQSYQITTDWSLLPVVDERVRKGIVVIGATSIFSVFQPKKGEYVRFYLRKSPTSLFITQRFFHFDELLSYIGGLFGLILLFVQIPLTYYNTCCFELALASQLFSYPKSDKMLKSQTDSQQEMGSLVNLPTGKHSKVNNSLETVQDQQMRNGEKEQTDLHSVSRFNFLVYLVYLPFFGLKNLGWKNLNNKYLTPFYEGIKKVRKHIDLGKMISRFLYLERATEAVLDADQRMLLHVFPKEDLRRFDQHRSGFKLRDKLKEKAEPLESNGTSDPLIKGVIDFEELRPRSKELFEAYQRLTRRMDTVSRYIVNNMDPEIMKIIVHAEEINNDTKQRITFGSGMQPIKNAGQDQPKRRNNLLPPLYHDTKVGDIAAIEMTTMNIRNNPNSENVGLYDEPIDTKTHDNRPKQVDE